MNNLTAALAVIGACSLIASIVLVAGFMAFYKHEVIDFVDNEEQEEANLHFIDQLKDYQA